MCVAWLVAPGGVAVQCRHVVRGVQRAALRGSLELMANVHVGQVQAADVARLERAAEVSGLSR